jgi:hypothetical protein
MASPTISDLLLASKRLNVISKFAKHPLVPRRAPESGKA